MNIGASHAATSLAKMVDKTIDIGIPNIKIIPIEETINVMDYNDLVAGVFLKTSEEYPTYILLLFSFDNALILSNLLLGSEPDLNKAELDEMEQSAMEEVGNILMSSFFDSVTELIGISMIPGPPAVAVDMPSTLMEYLMLEIGAAANEVIVFDIEINEEKENSFRFDLFLMPEPKSIKMILEKLGV